MSSLSLLGVFTVVAILAAGQLSFAQAAAPATRPAGALRVVSFNIRNSDANDGPNRWPLRQDLFVRMVRKLDADVLGFQEVLARQQDDLTVALPEYDTYFVGRDDGQRKGEGSPIYFRKSRFELRDKGTFWLSETPERMAKGWDAVLPRICSWAVLHDKTLGRDV